jgi:purine-cytosine permease-like protein
VAILAVICSGKFASTMSTPFLYIGPGLGVGAGILIILVLVLIIAAFGYRIWYTIKKARKK